MGDCIREPCSKLVYGVIEKGGVLRYSIMGII